MNTEVKLCPKCGAEFDDLNIRCPFCGFYNDDLALKQEESEMEELRSRHETVMKKMPQALVIKNRRRILSAMVAAVIFIIVAVIAGSIIYNISERAKYAAKQKFIARLEEMYQNGEYDELFDAYYGKGYYGASFGKYENTADIAMERYYAVRDLETLSAGDADAASLERALQKSFRCLYLAQRMREQGFIYGEGDAVEKLEDEMKSAMKELWGMSDDEIREGTERYDGRNTDYSELAERLINGM